MSQATGCSETVHLLNAVFQSYFIFNDGHEIRSRLQAGHNVVDIVQGLNRKFGRREYRPFIRALGNAWPPQHLEAITTMVRWALEKLDTDDRVMIEWKGDASRRETVTKFELRDHLLTIEFAHPPGILPVA
jgi:hypothetical protein